MENKPVVIQHPLLAQSTHHGFFTRIGGVSQGEYASLNCGFKSGDKPECIAKNRKIAADYMGVSAQYLWGGMQNHTAKIIHVTKENCLPDEADGAVTTDPDIAISIVTADCAPVLLSTRQGDIVGAAHAGWRGAAAGILEEVVDQMHLLGANHKDIVAVVGPCISSAHYEVQDDMRSEILRLDPEGKVFFTPIRDGHYLFDLGHYCVDRLKRKRVGVTALLGRDTFMNPTYFFSHRRRLQAKKAVLGLQISSIVCRHY